MRRVLIIDDDTFYGGLVAKTFGQRRWLPVTCLNMEDALKEIEALKVDLIVTDIFMPGIGGIEGIPFLKSKAPDVPIIAISGGWDKLPPDEAVKAAVKVGANGGLSKPIKGDLLDKLLADLNLGGTSMGEPNWPQTFDETTDWDEVFDAPTNGLIAWIGNADTFEVLKVSAVNMFAHLFQNTRSTLDSKAYIERLKDILAQDTSLTRDDTLKQIQSLLNEIKTKFKQEDAKFIAEKRLEKFEQHRAKRMAVPKAPKKKPWYEKYALPIGGGVVACLVAIGVLLMVQEEPPQEPKEDKITQTEKKLITRTPMGTTERSTLDGPRQDPDKLYRAPERGGKAWRAPSQNFEKPADAPPDMPAVLALGAVQWASSPYRSERALLRMAPLLTVKDWESMPIICDRVPAITDLINTELSQLASATRVPSAQELDQFSQSLQPAINRVLDLELVQKVSMVYGTPLQQMDFINDPCRPLSPKEIDALNLLSLR
ncbi:response regulator [Magnetovibrio sp. PR-2]|uniref:response regulator n=1 Tax=Magnetovibrio sp. PR-2 TaxID=3120356 RepID=UPI002FCE5DD5